MSERILDGKVAIVTGASRGIGRAVAQRFAANGAKVVINWVRGEAEALSVAAAIEKDGGQALPVQTDVAMSADVAKLVEATVDQFGRIDILVNNARRDDRQIGTRHR